MHDFEQLFILSGIYTQFEQEIFNSPSFRNNWSIVSKWNENSRYLAELNGNDVKDFLTSVKEVMEWIQKHL